MNADIRDTAAAGQTGDCDDLRHARVTHLRMHAERRTCHRNARHTARHDGTILRGQQNQVGNLFVCVLNADRLDQKDQLERRILDRLQGGQTYLGVKSGVLTLTEAQRVIDEIHAAVCQPVGLGEVKFSDVETDFIVSRYFCADGSNHVSQRILRIKLSRAQHNPAHPGLGILAHLLYGRLLIIAARLAHDAPLFTQ